MDLDKQTIRAIRKADTPALDRLLGEGWRDMPVRVKDAMAILCVSRVTVWRHAVKNKGGYLILGNLVEYQAKRLAQPKAGDYDQLGEWSKENNWPLEAARSRAIAFVRIAYGARKAGKDLTTARFLGPTISAWNVGSDTQEWWASRSSPKKVPVYNWSTGKQESVYLWTPSEVLDIFLWQTQVDQALLPRNTVHGLRWHIERRCKTFVANPKTWRGAVSLQLAWTYYWRLVALATDQTRDETYHERITMHVHVSRSLNRLAITDPDWTRPPLDTSSIDPDAWYNTWLAPATPEIMRSGIVHTPHNAMGIRVFPNPMKKRVSAIRQEKRLAVTIGRTMTIRGERLIAYPHGYSF